MKWKAFFLLGVLVVVIGLPALVCGARLYIAVFGLPVSAAFEADQKNYFTLTDTVARSLIFNRTENIRSYVDSDKWDFILQWETEHIPIANDPWNCHYLDLDFGPGMTLVTIGDQQTGSYYTQMVCDSKDYALQLEHIDFQVIGGKWTLRNWERICESVEGVSKCWE